MLERYLAYRVRVVRMVVRKENLVDRTDGQYVAMKLNGWEQSKAKAW